MLDVGTYIALIILWIVVAMGLVTHDDWTMARMILVAIMAAAHALLFALWSARREFRERQNRQAHYLRILAGSRSTEKDI